MGAAFGEAGGSASYRGVVKLSPRGRQSGASGCEPTKTVCTGVSPCTAGLGRGPDGTRNGACPCSARHVCETVQALCQELWVPEACPRGCRSEQGRGSNPGPRSPAGNREQVTSVKRANAR